MRLRVDDLHALAPKRCLSVGGAVIQPLSLQLANSYSIPTSSPCIVDPGYVFDGTIRRNAVILELDGRKMASLEDVESHLADCRDGQVCSFSAQNIPHAFCTCEADGRCVIQDLLVTYHNMAEPSVRRQVVVTLPNSAWFGCAKREAVQAGPEQPVEWSKTELAREGPTERVAPFGTEAAAVDGAGASTMIGGALRGRTSLEQELAPSLVTVDFTRPFVRSS